MWNSECKRKRIGFRYSFGVQTRRVHASKIMIIMIIIVRQKGSERKGEEMREGLEKKGRRPWRHSTICFEVWESKKCLSRKVEE